MRRLIEWEYDYIVPTKYVVASLLNNVNWDNLPILTDYIHVRVPILKKYHHLITCCADVILPNETTRLKDEYINSSECMEVDYSLLNDLLPFLSERRMWDLYVGSFTLSDMTPMINELVNEWDYPKLTDMWTLCQNTELSSYVNMSRLENDIIKIIGGKLDEA